MASKRGRAYKCYWCEESGKTIINSRARMVEHTSISINVTWPTTSSHSSVGSVCSGARPNRNYLTMLSSIKGIMILLWRRVSRIQRIT
ncbi:hypothetical protein DPMN_074842 [Dreissena polymorpha]|nr:hypothetical protein DPMN_074842 [Dreissena polymorpha]